MSCRVRDGFADREAGGEQHWDLRFAVVVGERDELDREAEEPGEPDGVDAGRDGFDVATEHLGADVDAEDGLGPELVRRCRRLRPVRCERIDQAVLFGAVERVLQDEAVGEVRPEFGLLSAVPGLLHAAALE